MQEDPNVLVLFDGETFEGWRAYNGTEVPAAWTIEDGAIKINGSGREKPVQPMAATLFMTVHLKTLN